MSTLPLYHRHRFPAEIISHCVWLYFPFPLSFRDVEEMLAMRGEMLGHSAPMAGFGYASRITPGYAHATWGAMLAAVESLEQPVQSLANLDRGKIVANDRDERKVG